MEMLDKKGLSLLLFLETAAVDQGGKVNIAHMNESDMTLAEGWHEAGFIGFGRIIAADCSPRGTHWVHLSDDAMTAAHAERKARAKRMWHSRLYITTEEKREDAANAERAKGSV
jgi:hypothetical protein